MKDSYHTNPDTKPYSLNNVLKSLCTEYLHGSDKHHDNRSDSGDEEDEIPIQDRIFMFQSVTRFTDEIMKGGRNTNHPVVPIETGKEEKQPNKYGGDEYRQNTTSHPVQTLSKGHNDQVLKQQNDNHTNVRNFGGDEQQRKVEASTNRLKPEPHDKMLNYLKDKDSKKLEQISKEDLMKILERVCNDEEGKKCVREIITKKQPGSEQVTEL